MSAIQFCRLDTGPLRRIGMVFSCCWLCFLAMSGSTMASFDIQDINIGGNYTVNPIAKTDVNEDLDLGTNAGLISKAGVQRRPQAASRPTVQPRPAPSQMRAPNPTYRPAARPAPQPRAQAPAQRPQQRIYSQPASRPPTLQSTPQTVRRPPSPQPSTTSRPPTRPQQFSGNRPPASTHAPALRPPSIQSPAATRPPAITSRPTASPFSVNPRPPSPQPSITSRPPSSQPSITSRPAVATQPSVSSRPPISSSLTTQRPPSAYRPPIPGMTRPPVSVQTQSPRPQIAQPWISSRPPASTTRPGISTQHSQVTGPVTAQSNVVPGLRMPPFPVGRSTSTATPAVQSSVTRPGSTMPWSNIRTGASTSTPASRTTPIPGVTPRTPNVLSWMTARPTSSQSTQTASTTRPVVSQTPGSSSRPVIPGLISRPPTGAKPTVATGVSTNPASPSQPPTVTKPPTALSWMASKPASSQSTPQVKPSGKAEVPGVLSQPTTGNQPQTGSSTQLASNPLQGSINANFGSGSTSSTTPQQTTSTGTGSIRSTSSGTPTISSQTGPKPQAQSQAPTTVRPPSPTQPPVKPSTSVATQTLPQSTTTSATQGSVRPPRLQSGQIGAGQTGAIQSIYNQPWGGPVAVIAPYQGWGTTRGGRNPSRGATFQQMIAGMISAMGPPINPVGIEPEYVPNENEIISETSTTSTNLPVKPTPKPPIKPTPGQSASIEELVQFGAELGFPGINNESEAQLREIRERNRMESIRQRRLPELRAIESALQEELEANEGRLEILKETFEAGILNTPGPGLYNITPEKIEDYMKTEQRIKELKQRLNDIREVLNQ